MSKSFALVSALVLGAVAVQAGPVVVPREAGAPTPVARGSAATAVVTDACYAFGEKVDCAGSVFGQWTSLATKNAGAAKTTTAVKAVCYSFGNEVPCTSTGFGVWTSYSTPTGAGSPEATNTVISSTSFDYDASLYGTGCYQDGEGYGRGRTLNDFTFSTNAMTNELCSNTCASEGYRFSGTQYHDQCFCGNNDPTPDFVEASNCDTACSGKSSETCGGSWALTVYESNQIGNPSTTNLASQFQQVGCYADSTSARTFNDYYFSSGDASVEFCAQTCTSKGFAYSGVENGYECFCSATAPASTKLDSTSCNVVCSGNFDDICGGYNALSVVHDTSI